MAKKVVGKFSLKILIVSLLIVFSIGFIGSIFTSGQTSSNWYNSIRPIITPPNFVFPIVWNVLFFLIGVSLYFTWVNSNGKEKKKVAIVFGLNFVLNILWSVFYFYLHNPILSFIDIILLEISIGILIYTSYKISRKAGYLLVPYFIWVMFATVLNWLSI